jgi:transposase
MVQSKDFTKRMRASIILESANGIKVSEISKKLHLNKHTVRLWIKRFNSEGIDGLESRTPPGRPPSITNEQKDEMVRIALASPRSLGVNVTTWSLPALRGYLERNRIVKKISESWIRKLLMRKGVKHIRSRRWKTSNDPDYYGKVKRILELYNNPPDDGVVISLDEKGSITVKDHGGSSWGCDAPRISDRQKIRGRTELVAAYAPHTGRVFYRFSGKKRAYHVTGLLRQVRAAIPSPMKLYVILDNHHLHTGGVMKNFTAEDGFVEPVFTPKNASWWNAIEQIFADLQKKVLNNSSFVDVEEAKDALKKRLRDLRVRLREMLAVKGRYTFAFDLWKEVLMSHGTGPRATVRPPLPPHG